MKGCMLMNEPGWSGVFSRAGDAASIPWERLPVAFVEFLLIRTYLRTQSEGPREGALQQNFRIRTVTLQRARRRSNRDVVDRIQGRGCQQLKDRATVICSCQRPFSLDGDQLYIADKLACF